MSKNSIAVVYKSKSGFTEKYARWLSQNLDAPLLDGGKMSSADLADYDTIIYGGGLYAGGLNGLSLIKKFLPQLGGKNIIIFAVGASPVREEVEQAVEKHNIGGELKDRAKFFMLRGGFDLNKCTFVDKILMSILKARLKSLKNPTPDEAGMLAAYNHPVDFCAEKNIQPILEYVRSLED